MDSMTGAVLSLCVKNISNDKYAFQDIFRFFVSTGLYVCLLIPTISHKSSCEKPIFALSDGNSSVNISMSLSLSFSVNFSLITKTLFYIQSNHTYDVYNILQFVNVPVNTSNRFHTKISSLKQGFPYPVLLSLFYCNLCNLVLKPHCGQLIRMNRHALSHPPIALRNNKSMF